MINRAYGVLTDGRVSSGGLGYRYSDVRCPRSVRVSVDSLMSLVPDKYMGLFANLLIELLRSSHLWSSYVRKWDTDNTYQTAVVPDDLYVELKGFEFSELVKWADSVVRNTDEFHRSPNDPAIDRVCSALFNVITAGD